MPIPYINIACVLHMCSQFVCEIIERSFEIKKSKKHPKKSLCKVKRYAKSQWNVQSSLYLTWLDLMNWYLL